jgi:multidrug efflux pump subunit AcrA (membrane-fusion protein)
VVFVYQEGTVRRRPVELGIGNRQQYEITAGLEEGEQIVAGSTSLLADGMAVVPREGGEGSPSVIAETENRGSGPGTRGSG